ncbi:MAG: hypothetical protein M3306_29075 [Actinomycetota bacterium]|nr:hypothetical protein [Actinomycetota bacterium]
MSDQAADLVAMQVLVSATLLHDLVDQPGRQLVLLLEEHLVERLPLARRPNPVGK